MEPTVESLAAAITDRPRPMLVVADVPATVAWYVALGFRVVQAHDDDFALVALGAGEVMISAGGCQPTDAVRLWFYTDAVDDLYRAIKARGVATRFVEELYDPFYGGRQFSIEDPNGVHLVFYRP